MDDSATSSALQLQLFRDTGFLLARVSGLAIRTTNRMLRSLGLRARHFSVLSVAVGSGGASQRELSVLLGLDPSQVVALVDDLEREGLVERRTSGKDRRARVIAATAKGRDRYEQAEVLVDRARAEFLAPLPPADQVVLLDLLARLAADDLSDGKEPALRRDKR